jgi:hypothetical protein
MKGRIFLGINVSCFALALALAGSPAYAQATRTWVSGVGDDANPCSRTAPCKTFAGAISKTATGGEINCLDPGGFGAVTITKSITLECSETVGGILAANFNGVIVNASTAGSVVILRGLDIDGANTTTGNGIRIIAAAGGVIIDNCRIYGFGGTTTNGRGVAIETTADTRVTIQNSQFYHNNFVGIHSNPTSGNVVLDIDNVQLSQGGTTAIQLRQNTTATINRTTVVNHATGAGLTVELTTATALVSNSNFSNNAFGIFNGNGGSPTVRLYGTVITGNTTQGLLINAGSVISSGNNVIRGNAGNEVPSSTITTQ